MSKIKKQIAAKELITIQKVIIDKIGDEVLYLPEGQKFQALAKKLKPNRFLDWLFSKRKPLREQLYRLSSLCNKLKSFRETLDLPATSICLNEQSINVVIGTKFTLEQLAATVDVLNQQLNSHWFLNSLRLGFDPSLVQALKLDAQSLLSQSQEKLVTFRMGLEERLTKAYKATAKAKLSNDSSTLEKLFSQQLLETWLVKYDRWVDWLTSKCQNRYLKTWLALTKWLNLADHKPPVAKLHPKPDTGCIAVLSQPMLFNSPVQIYINKPKDSVTPLFVPTIYPLAVASAPPKLRHITEPSNLPELPSSNPVQRRLSFSS